jgi:hypothetical protein
MTDRSDTLSTNAATILAGMLIAKQADTHQASAPAFVQDAVTAAFNLEAEVMARLKATALDRPYFRRRAHGGWDTQEQQDADDAHRRVERRKIVQPDHVPNDPYDRRKQTYDHPGNMARD